MGHARRPAAWLCEAFRRALLEAKAILWFDEPTNEGGWIDPWPIDSSEEARSAFQAAVAPGFYVGDLGDLLARVGRAKIPPPDGRP